jgi:VanZ family protein
LAGAGNGLHFGAHGTIVSRGALVPQPEPMRDDWTLELWLQPGRAYQSRTILAFHNPQRARGFSLRQPQTDLVAESRVWSKDLAVGGQAFGGGVFDHSRLVFLTLASGPDGTSLYLDGSLFRLVRQFRLSSDELSGQLVVANSPVRNDSWSGELRGLALYNKKLTPAQIFRHYTAWTQKQRLRESHTEGAVALYLFAEDSGSVVHNQIPSGADLVIPERYLELHEALLKRPWDEYNQHADDWETVVLNIGGFVPLGFLLYGYLSLVVQTRRGALATVLTGAVLSLTIEIVQSFLPTRDSGMTDIITNTLGTAVGVVSCYLASIVSESLRHSRHVNMRRLAGLFVRRQDRPIFSPEAGHLRPVAPRDPGTSCCKTASVRHKSVESSLRGSEVGDRQN